MKKTILIALVLAVVWISAFSQVNLQDGLVGYWPFNGNANDESGNLNHGTVFGATLTTDRFGNDSRAYFFDGVDDYIRIFQSNSLNSLQTTTIAYWIKYYKPTSGPNDRSSTISNGAGNSPPLTDGFYTHGNTNEINHLLGIGGGLGDFVSVAVPFDATVQLPLQDFEFITFLVDTDFIKTYKNAALQESSLREGKGISRPQQNWYIGQNGAPNFFLNGMMDDIRIYNRVLNDLEIDSLYREGVLGTGISDYVSDKILKVYPTINHGQLFIEFDEAIDKPVISLYNSNGELIHFDNSFGNGITKHEIDVSIYAKGLYLLELRTDNGRTTRKLIIQ